MARIPGALLREGLMSLVPHELQRKVAQLAPTHYEAPSGSRVPISYDGETTGALHPRAGTIRAAVEHPAIAGGAVPLTLELLSPAHRPIQTTRDLPGFWRGSWADVRADMRGRYPKHVWPDDPASAEATSRAKPRGPASACAPPWPREHRDSTALAQSAGEGHRQDHGSWPRHILKATACG